MDDFTINDRTRSLYAGTVLLNHMVSEDARYDVLLSGNETGLEPTLGWLLTRELVEISKKNFYEVTEKGRKAVAAFQKHYLKVLQYFDVFSAVDLEVGEFAFAHYQGVGGHSKWQRYLQDERWDDLRVAVALQLGADPIELVFAHFMSEGRFDLSSAAWGLSLREGLVWTEISEICRSSIRSEDLGYENLSGSDVLADIIDQGFLLVRELSDEDPAVMAHLARWAPLQDESWTPDSSQHAFWKRRWALDVTA